MRIYPYVRAPRQTLNRDPIVVSGVPQLSLGEKAVLTATPDFVSLRAIPTPRQKPLLPGGTFPFLCARAEPVLTSRIPGIRRPGFPPGDPPQLNTQVRG